MKLIKTGERYVVVDESELQPKDVVLSTGGNICIVGEYPALFDGYDKKITHSYPHLEGTKPLDIHKINKAIGGVDVKELAETWYDDVRILSSLRADIGSFIAGYNQAISDNKKEFTEEEVRKAFEEGVDAHFMAFHLESFEVRYKYRKTRLESFISTLRRKEWEVEVDEEGNITIIK